MTPSEAVLWFGLIFMSDMLAIVISRVYDSIKNRKLDINCDNCEKPLPLARTPDKQFYMCRECYVAYIAEHFPNLDPNLRKIFRRIKR